MGVLKVEGVSKAFGIEQLFSGISFELDRGDKVGLIGANGTGKTTLFRCMLGLEQADSGRVILPAGDSICYVEQDTALMEGTLEEELRSAFQDVIGYQEQMACLETAIAKEVEEQAQAILMKEYAKVVERFERGGGYSYETMIRRVASGLGFSTDDLARPVATFSGGQKTRISLAKALVRQPDFLFLDEPTNHLDIGMVEWLESFLKEYSGGVLIISHDRYFLDRVVGRVLELENKKITGFRGNYSSYLNQKIERVASQQNAYDKQQAYIAKTEAYIDRFRAGIKSRQARGRQSQLSRLERLESPEVADRVNMTFTMLEGCAERVAELVAVSAAYGENILFEQLSLLIRKGEGLALVGPNGAGKTTILKLLTGELEPRAGRIKIGNRVQVGYFSQEHEGLNSKQRVIDEITNEFGFSEERARNCLGALLFYGDEVFKLVGDLSGGEKARLALLKLMLSGANFLVLDEPTNHLDIAAKEAVESAIMDFPGTFLVVSHDRYLLDKVADRVVELAAGKLTEYLGNYSYYRDKKNQEQVIIQRIAVKEEGTKKKPRPQKRTQDIAKLVTRLEGEIAELEAAISEMEIELNDPANHVDPEVSKNLANQHKNLEEELATKYEEWLTLTEE